MDSGRAACHRERQAEESAHGREPQEEHVLRLGGFGGALDARRLDARGREGTFRREGRPFARSEDVRRETRGSRGGEVHRLGEGAGRRRWGGFSGRRRRSFGDEVARSNRNGFVSREGTSCRSGALSRHCALSRRWASSRGGTLGRSWARRRSWAQRRWRALRRQRSAMGDGVGPRNGAVGRDRGLGRGRGLRGGGTLTPRALRSQGHR